jgi:hypothetical protein
MLSVNTTTNDTNEKYGSHKMRLTPQALITTEFEINIVEEME